MFRQLLFSLCLIGLATATLNVDVSQHCVCSELNQQDCGQAQSWCLWNTSSAECQDHTFTCADISSQVLCDAEDFCKWKTSTCEEYYPSCADGTSAELCPTGIGCLWNKQNQCSFFTSCSDYSVENCPIYEWCSPETGSCAPYVFVTCSSFTTADTCTGAASKTSWCSWANDNTCKTMTGVSNCSDLNNFKLDCNDRDGCRYDGSICRSIKCSDFGSEAECGSIRVEAADYYLCAWVNGACDDAVDSSIFTKDTCFSRTYKNYKWTSDNKCVACDNLTNNDEVSNSVILGAFILLALIA
ncbi:unnamed protein product (macronuclear) [Paramecium tetraurelia]|uniref:Mini antigen n=1 Tax=Paramecium tetraurelia TaxID=5888 RepID=A0DW90_PARTE|nr:uncharacterized protein GSPATT00020948001 [Paramecium tetraurelia]CAK87307.1 unnamed protein product [Paramecium tetraurelia]|eukprot:XP_001454704.1 hypothetical protein (macronuclear) [Paramecium tetraurelia strain d4-2]